VPKGLKLLLNINIQTGAQNGTKLFADDLLQYQEDVNTAIDVLDVTPEVAIIENEESNSTYYNTERGGYLGSAKAYMAQLLAAVNVLHPRGIKVTNGGITMTPLLWLYAHSLSTDSCEAVMHRNHLPAVAPRSVDFVDTVIRRLPATSVDYVNFHWYHRAGDDLNDLIGAINYLRERTGKTVISNEMGQFDNDPQTTRNLVQLTLKEKLPYVVFYSDSDTDRSFPFNDSSGALTIIGEAYRKVLKESNSYYTGSPY
jgi:hypothetical protein